MTDTDSPYHPKVGPLDGSLSEKTGNGDITEAILFKGMHLWMVSSPLKKAAFP